MTQDPGDNVDDWMQRQIDGLEGFEANSGLHLKTQLALDFYNKAPEYAFDDLNGMQVDVFIGDIQYALEVVGATRLGVVVDLMDDAADVSRYVIGGSVTFAVPASEIPEQVIHEVSGSFEVAVPGKYLIFNDEEYPSIVTNNGLCKDAHLKLYKVYTVEEAQALVSSDEEMLVRGAMLNLISLDEETVPIFVEQDGFLTFDALSYVRIRDRMGQEVSFGVKPTSLN